MLLWHHPEVAYRDCGDCKKWLYDERTGERKKDPRTKRPIRRKPHELVRCKTTKGCKKGTPESQKSLTAVNMEIYSHYLECQAVSDWPNEDCVRNAAASIRYAEKTAERMDQWKIQTAVETLSAKMEIFLKAMMAR